MDAQARRSQAVALARAAIAGIALYVAIDVALVFLRPGFSVLHNAESDYGSRGAYAWVMDANFLLRCLLSIAVVRALGLVGESRGRLRIGLGLLVVWAVSSGLLAFFPDDPVGSAMTDRSARVHQVLAVIAFPAVVLGTRLTTRALRRLPAWRPYVPALTVLSWGALVPIVLLGHAHLRPHTLGGLYEKVFLAMELAWLLVAAAGVVSLAGGSGRAGAARVSS